MTTSLHSILTQYYLQVKFSSLFIHKFLVEISSLKSGFSLVFFSNSCRLIYISFFKTLNLCKDRDLWRNFKNVNNKIAYDSKTIRNMIKVLHFWPTWKYTKSIMRIYEDVRCKKTKHNVNNIKYFIGSTELLKMYNIRLSVSVLFRIFSISNMLFNLHLTFVKYNLCCRIC